MTKDQIAIAFKNSLEYQQKHSESVISQAPVVTSKAADQETEEKPMTRQPVTEETLVEINTPSTDETA